MTTLQLGCGKGVPDRDWVYAMVNLRGRSTGLPNGADRKDIITMMKEQIKRFEGQPDMKGRA